MVDFPLPCGPQIMARLSMLQSLRSKELRDVLVDNQGIRQWIKRGENGFWKTNVLIYYRRWLVAGLLEHFLGKKYVPIQNLDHFGKRFEYGHTTLFHNNSPYDN